MKFDLYDHNRVAYTSATEMMDSFGRAAVIHPTGTGKSFIGFQLAADHPDEQILWFSPSRYIFETQLENLAEASGGEKPENIAFFTYAGLMLMSEEEIDGLRPAYIILDEFHCCGAQMWGQGVRRLLRQHPEAPVLGLSATNIRYLDNQRDMAEELFDGHIASEITLGEAIVRGILNPPKYVLSVFKYQNDLEKYEARVRKSHSKAVRDEGEKYLEALRRALENADGLDVIFDKHMTDRTGKYIVFCACKEHMDEMMGHMEWFAKVDKHPHVYSFYCADPSAGRAFEDFKADEDPEHLKLLFCIDALNQGIHVPGVSGVILLRPTVSPIIYKQQIGRALSTSGKKDAVIFDIVLNIESLCSIGAIEEEMEIATAYYRSLGESEYVVNEHFRIMDEVRDCIQLFDSLNHVLTASWDLMYEKAKAYSEENGSLDIPHRYVTADGYSLGSWVNAQRAVRAGTMHGSLTEGQIEKLDALGMVWESRNELAWARNYQAAERYFEEHGALNAPGSYVTADGVRLGEWLKTLRKWKNAGIHPKYLSPDRIAQLDEIGMVWDMPDYYWEQMYREACEYYLEHRNLDVPDKYVTEDGARLGAWIHRLRSARNGTSRRGSLTEDRIRRLDDIGMVWTVRNETLWDRYYAQAKQYYRLHGNLSVPKDFESDGLKLGGWIARQKAECRAGRVSGRRAEKLRAIGIGPEADPWESRVRLAKRYMEEHHINYIPQDTVVDGVWIGKWLAVQRKALEAGTLTPAQEKLLGEVPLRTKSEMLWENAYELARDYYEEHGSLDVRRKYVCDNGYGLGNWVSYQRKLRREGHLSEEQIRRLDAIGFVWKTEKAAV
ncbi:MAG: Helicase associated domain protein [Clostridiales bacterium]|nr:Helicase associated domain protein [Clostridiales bacterium]